MANPLIATPTVRHMKRTLPGLRGLLEYLELNALDVYHFHEDFDGGVAAGALTTGTDPESKWAIYTNASGTATFTASSRNGICTLDTIGATANDYAQIYVPLLPCIANQNTVLAVRLALASIANVKAELGFIDSPTNTVGVVNVLNTSTYNATDGVSLCLDTNDTTNGTHWKAMGVRNTTGATKIASGIAAAAATYQTLIVVLRSANAKFFILNADGGQIYESAWMTNAVTATVGLSPFVLVRTRTTAAKAVTIDSVDYWQRRTST